MKCPVDKIDMIVVEHRKIELDYCHKCAGVWFDAGELDLLFSTLPATDKVKSQSEFLTQEKASVNEAARKCPICGRKMDKVWIGKSPRVLIDSCPLGDGLWFDGGELREVLCQIPNLTPTGSEEVLSFLKDAVQADCQPEAKKEP